MSTDSVPVARKVLDNAEKARRRSAIASARGNQRGEGLHPSAFLMSLDERFIDGELSTEDVIDELNKHYGLKRKAQIPE